MNITEAVEIVFDEQQVFDHVKSPMDAVEHILDTMITQDEYDRGLWVPGVAVLDGPDPEYNDEGSYEAYLEVLTWFKFEIDLVGFMIDMMRIEGGEEVYEESPLKAYQHGLWAMKATMFLLNNLGENVDKMRTRIEWMHLLGADAVFGG